MIYLLYNPQSNNQHNDINVVLKGKSESNVTTLSLLTYDVRDLLSKLTPDDKVLLCGGDGTIRRFATNTYGFKFPCPVCVLSSGTGNDFVRDINQIGIKKIGLLKDIRPYLKNLPTIEVKGLKCKFINGAGLGIDGDVCRVAEEQKKKSTKKINYTTIALKLFAGGYKCPNARITIDGVVHEYRKVYLASTMKGRFYGGGMMISPTQDRNGETLSVMILHHCSRVKALTIFSSVYKGGHIKYKDIVEICQGKHITVEFDRPTALQIDGEVVTDVRSYTVYMDDCSTVKK